MPDIVPPDTDVVDWTLAEMDKWGVQVGMCGLSDNGIEAKKRYPDRFVLTMEAQNTNDVMGTVRQIKEAKAEHDIVARPILVSTDGPGTIKSCNAALQRVCLC